MNVVEMDDRVDCMACLATSIENVELEPGVIVGDGVTHMTWWRAGRRHHPLALCQRSPYRERFEPREESLGQWRA